MAAESPHRVVPERVVSKLAMLFLTLLPACYLALFMLFWLSLVFNQAPAWLGSGGFPPLLFVGAHCSAMFLSLVLAGWYIVAAVKNPALDSTMKIIWVLVLFQFNLFAMPVYWYLYVWRRQAPHAVTAGVLPSA